LVCGSGVRAEPKCRIEKGAAADGTKVANVAKCAIQVWQCSNKSAVGTL
jgi:hypothetical protein